MISGIAAITVCLVPLGAHDATLVGPVTRGIEHVYGFDVNVLPARDLPKAAWYPKGKRYRAEKILDYLDAEVAPAGGCDAIMGWTRVDVSTTKGKIDDWGVLGLGRIGGPSAVVSSYRMRARARATVVHRAVKTVNHELGHVLGLDHGAGADGCVMDDARGTVRSVDRESGLLCPHERTAIEDKWHVTLPERDHFDWAWVADGPK